MDLQRDSKRGPGIRLSRVRIAFHTTIAAILFILSAGITISALDDSCVIAKWVGTYIVVTRAGTYVFVTSMVWLPLVYLVAVLLISKWLRRPQKNTAHIPRAVFRKETIGGLCEMLNRLRSETVSRKEKLCVHFMGGQPKSFYEKLEKPGVRILLCRCLLPLELRFIPAWEAYLAVGSEIDLWNQIVDPAAGCSMIRVCPLPTNVEALFDGDESDEYRGLDEIERSFANRSIEFDLDPRVVVSERNESRASN